MATDLLEVTKREDGGDMPASAFLYVPDPNKPSTWKLPFKEFVGGKLQVTKKKLGMAAAALGAGFRGQKASLPPEAKAAAKRKLRGLYAKLGVKPEDMPPAIREGDEDQGEDLIFEDVQAFEGSRVDGEAGTIEGVVLAGPTSKNGRRYRTAGLAKAVPLYDGVRVYLNHPTADDLKARHGGRDVRELAGWVTHPRFSEGKVKGTLNILPLHAWVLEVAARKPDLLGMSHVARGAITKEGEETIVEEILAVRSVDIVSDPATTSSLFEHREDVDGDEGSPGHDEGGSDMTTKELRESHPDLVAEIREELLREIKASGEMDGLKAQVTKLEESVKALTKERDEAREKIAAAETAKVVEEKLASEDLKDLPDKIKARVRKAFEGKSVKAEDIERQINELREIAEEFGEGRTKITKPPIVSSDRKGTKKTEDVRESIIFGMMGAERPTEKED